MLKIYEYFCVFDRKLRLRTTSNSFRNPVQIN